MVLLLLPFALGTIAYAQSASPVTRADFRFVDPSGSGSFLAGREASIDFNNSVAAEFFLDALESDWNNPLLIERAFVSLISAGEIDTGTTMANRLLEVDPENEMAFVALGAVALKERRYASVMSQLENMSPDTLVGITGLVIRAWALVATGRNEEADAVMAGIDRPGFVEFLRLHRGLMADVANNRPLALDLLKQSYEADGFQYRVVETYARALANGGDFAGAQEVLDAYATRGPGHPYLRVIAADIAQGRRPGKLAGDAQQGAAELLFSLGMALSTGPTTDLSVFFLRLARYLDPAGDLVTVSLGEILGASGRYELANEQFRAIPADSVLLPQAAIRMAQNMDAMHDRPAAIAQLRSVVAKNPGDLDATLALADMLRRDKQYVEAAEVYGTVIEISGPERPGTWRHYYARAISYERAKLWEKAEVDFKQALKLSPDQPQVLNYLGYSWVDMGDNLQVALDMIRKAVELRPQDGYIVDSLGWAYYRMDRLEEAVVELERAVALMPGDPTINDHLGDAYWKVGRRLEARYQWNIARDLGLEEEGAQEMVLRKIEVGLDEAQAERDAKTQAERDAKAGSDNT
jgi:tetratricopeptide (TPR) repeat protein